MAASIHYEEHKSLIEIRAHLVLYGHEATPELAGAIESEINHIYNEPHVQLMLRNQPTSVRFRVGVELVSLAQAQLMARYNTDFQYNFIRIEAENFLTRSFMGFGLGDNSGHWITSDQLGISTTAAHEFGHGLGLDHPQHPDFRGSGGPPPLMAARGSLVDSQYQWDPSAAAGAYGGTMKPHYRRLQRQEIIQILEGLTFEDTDTYLIGYISNKIFDRLGRVLELT
ncbi:hypothetical protein [Dyadobacter tibetensis]|uniref:hypothetical protein n=1 Tax=Dyadobacter tibetensis TaxID=1211851 RepID=UPI000472E362|nr:hypothetical protein [Dyadobacter tibetensis]